MSKINKLNSGLILSAYSKEFTQKKLILNIGNKDYEILVDEKFKTSKIKEMILEAITSFDTLKEYNENIKMSYYMFLLIKYFTDIEIAKTDSLEEQIRILNAMIDMEIYDKIINTFDEKEMKKASDFMISFSEKLKDMMEQNKSKNQIEEAIEKELEEKVGE